MDRPDIPTLDLAPEHLALVLALLRQHVPEAEVWAYGSRVRGGAQECSDLDLVLRQPDDLSRETAGLDDLREALRDSQLPVLVEVQDWARMPASFKQGIGLGHAVLQRAAPAFSGRSHAA